jgi:hypothetical protein
VKPTLSKWEMLWDYDPSKQIELQNSYVATCTLFPDGTLNLKSDPEGRIQMRYGDLIALLEEARTVAVHYYGESWGKTLKKP